MTIDLPVRIAVQKKKPRKTEIEREEPVDHTDQGLSSLPSAEALP